MSKVNDFETMMAEIFTDKDEANEDRLRLIEELQMENKLLWATIDRIKKEINKV